MLTLTTWRPEFSPMIVELMNEIAREVGDEPKSLANFEADLEHPEWSPRQQLIVALVEGEIVGYCDGWLGMYEASRATISLGVKMAWRGRGIGSALLERSCTFFKGKSEVVQTAVPTGAVSGDAFLRKRGFTDQSITMTLRRQPELFDCSLPQGTKLLNWHEFRNEAEFRSLHNLVFAAVPNWRPITPEAMNQYVQASWFQSGQLTFIFRELKPIAWLWMSFDDKAAGYVESLGVVSEERGKRFGSLLLKLSQDIAVNRGCRHVELSVDVTNTRALDIYWRAGFSIIKEHRWLQSTADAVLRAQRGLEA